MDPSAAPWRVLESATTPAAENKVGSESPAPAARTLQISPVTVAAVLGAVVLAVAAFLLASVSTGEGAVQVEGGGGLTPIRGGVGSALPDDAGVMAGTVPNVIVVEIVGAVRRPGVFRLPTGSRVGDLIEAAGGYGPRLDADRASEELNLAARLGDGDRVTVPSRDDVASPTTGTDVGGSPTGPAIGSLVDLNRATSAEPETPLDRAGDGWQDHRVPAREQAFTAVDDLRTRKLVGTKAFDKLKDLVSVR